MNLKKLFIADNEGKLDEFLDGLETKQLGLLAQQIKDELKRYEVVSKNYNKEKYEAERNNNDCNSGVGVYANYRCCKGKSS